MLWSITDVTRVTGVTSRTLRHYDAIGLLPPSATGSNGYRQYDEAALTRLQRILVLRQLGVPLTTIAAVLDGQSDDLTALREHREQLVAERERLDRQLRSVDTTIRKTEGGEPLMAEEMFDGFDHSQYREEVEQRWGAESYSSGDRWWKGLGADGQQAFQEEESAIRRALNDARAAGLAADSAEVQAITARHYRWVSAGWGGNAPSNEAYLGLGEMYVADARFADHYGGADAAAFLLEAMRAYTARRGTRP